MTGFEVQVVTWLLCGTQPGMADIRLVALTGVNSLTLTFVGIFITEDGGTLVDVVMCAIMFTDRWASSTNKTLALFQGSERSKRRPQSNESAIEVTCI